MNDGNSLEARWTRTWHDLGANAKASEPTLADLSRRHNEPHRAYHTFEHIEECLATFDAAYQLADHPAEIAAAIWFHDAVYDTRASDNEEQSASLADVRLADAGVEPSIRQRIVRLIVATKHTSPPGGTDEALLVDVDLHILAAGSERYAEYERQIRREYDWVPDEVFSQERAKILTRFLERPRIFTTDWFFDRMESAARHNLTASIQSLQR